MKCLHMKEWMTLAHLRRMQSWELEIVCNNPNVINITLSLMCNWVYSGLHKSNRNHILANTNLGLDGT